MQLISWQRALCLVLQAKAEVIAEYDAVVRSVTTQLKLPSVVRLFRYARVAVRFGVVRCTRKNVLLRDQYQCQYCGVKCRPGVITIDHVVPRSRGGKTTWTNVVAACHNCNRKKGNRSLEKSGMKLARAPQRPSWKELTFELTGDGTEDWLPYLDSTG